MTTLTPHDLIQETLNGMGSQPFTLTRVKIEDGQVVGTVRPPNQHLRENVLATLTEEPWRELADWEEEDAETGPGSLTYEHAMDAVDKWNMALRDKALPDSHNEAIVTALDMAGHGILEPKFSTRLSPEDLLPFYAEAKAKYHQDVNAPVISSPELTALVDSVLEAMPAPKFGHNRSFIQGGTAHICVIPPDEALDSQVARFMTTKLAAQDPEWNDLTAPIVPGTPAYKNVETLCVMMAVFDDEYVLPEPQEHAIAMALVQDGFGKMPVVSAAAVGVRHLVPAFMRVKAANHGK